jgi:hypothetical protein
VQAPCADHAEPSLNERLSGQVHRPVFLDLVQLESRHQPTGLHFGGGGEIVQDVGRMAQLLLDLRLPAFVFAEMLGTFWSKIPCRLLQGSSMPPGIVCTAVFQKIHQEASRRNEGCIHASSPTETPSARGIRAQPSVCKLDAVPYIRSVDPKTPAPLSG